jgi:hypothetical protein
MTPLDPIYFMSISCFGAISQEVLHWYNLRNRLSKKENATLIKSKYYWIITILLVLTSGVGTWILFSDQTDKNAIIYILGAAFPMIFKKLVETRITTTHLGSQAQGYLTFNETINRYFR